MRGSGWPDPEGKPRACAVVLRARAPPALRCGPPEWALPPRQRPQRPPSPNVLLSLLWAEAAPAPCSEPPEAALPAPSFPRQSMAAEEEEEEAGDCAARALRKGLLLRAISSPAAAREPHWQPVLGAGAGVMGDAEEEELPGAAAAEEAEAGAQVAVFKSRIWDVNQKSLYLQDNQLVAGYLQGPNSALEEKIYWVHNHAFDHEKFPVILSIQHGRQCLACSPGAWPALQLESINITDLHRDSHEASTRFTFFLSSRDGIWQFESAAHPGWFLCTSAKTSEPLGLTQDPGPSHVVDFYFQPC
ncbi:interleukin-1 beta-like [Sceloporus undulatus]|uniref:interleukin-1 beta-like n=1 Tax=Sceloporus undulatus TaxID=8520 RepID=UPI001C4AFEE4|nr:interleukin-1 beta-like [Sceloporus undulatus]